MSYNNTIKDKKEEDKLLIAKIEDKLQFCNSKNKITYTDFMQLEEKSIAKKFLYQNKIENYFFFGGLENWNYETRCKKRKIWGYYCKKKWSRCGCFIRNI